MKVLKLWCEWDFGSPELFLNEEVLYKYLDTIPESQWEEVELNNWQDAVEEGLLGWDIIEVVAE